MMDLRESRRVFDLVYEAPATEWVDGIPLGNGNRLKTRAINADVESSLLPMDASLSIAAELPSVVI